MVFDARSSNFVSSFWKQYLKLVCNNRHGDDRRDLRNAYDAGFSSEGSYDEWDPLGGYAISYHFNHFRARATFEIAFSTFYCGTNFEIEINRYDPYDDPFNNEDMMDDFGMGDEHMDMDLLNEMAMIGDGGYGTVFLLVVFRRFG